MKLPTKKAHVRLTAIVLLLGLLLAACGTSQPNDGGNTSAPGPSGSGSGSGSTADANEELRIGIPDDGDTLDPAHLSFVSSFSVATNIYSALVRYKTGTIDIEGDLATEWFPSEDGLTWTFKLRDNVKWHGSYGDFTAQDVVDHFNRIRDPETGSRWQAELKDVESIEAPDATTVVFHLSKPNAAFLHNVVAFRQGMITNQKAVSDHGDDYGRNPIGTGPYVLESWTPGTEIVLVANDDFYLGKPTIRKIRYIVIGDENVRMMALEKGEIDIAMTLTNPEVRKRLLNNPDLDLGEVESAGMGGIVLNTRMAPLDNPKVRQALYYAIDREIIAEVVMGGLASPATSELAPPYLGHTKDVPQYEYNPEKAKQLLAEAGYPDGFETTIYWLNTYQKEIVEAVQANWKDIGVTLKVNPVDAGTWVKAMGAGEAPVIWFVATRSDPNQFYSTFFHSRAFPPGLNGMFYDQVDDLIDAGAAEMDPAKRKVFYEEIQRKVMTDLPILPLFYTKAAHPHWNYVKGWGGRQNYDAYAWGVSIEK